VLAYIFWHAPADGVDTAAYEHDQVAFQRSLARTPPYGFCGSAVFRIASLPWDSAPGGLGSSPAELGGAAGRAYEDWYLVEDFAALGVLEEAAMGRGHRTSHDRVARALGSGVAGLYRLLEGPVTSAEQIGRCRHATWVQTAAGAPGRAAELAAFLGDGLDGVGASMWRRSLVLGPAPEYCLLAPEVPRGAAAARLPAGWRAADVTREAVFGAG
jgi:hypothetical protein